MENKIYLFLDDVRMPQVCVNYMKRRIGGLCNIYVNYDWLIVRNYDDFVAAVKKHANNIAIVSFDHDLADAHYDPKTWTQGFKYQEKTGYECAEFLKQYYEENKFELPNLFIHSMNPVGTERIRNLFKF